MKKYILIIAITILGAGCSEEWLEPKPQSFYSPENVYANKESFITILNSLLKSNRSEFYGDASALMTELLFSEVTVEGTTDKTGPAMDLPAQILPDAQLNNANFNRVGWYWTEGYMRIKNANIIISRIDDVEWANEQERNNILGKAYFHRARTYYRLVHQFGDVPLIIHEITGPKLDFYSVTRKSILEKCKKDLIFAAQWMESEQAVGDINKAAVNHLLTKVHLSLLEFDEAIASATAIIDDGNYHLMTERFGSDQNDPNHDVIWDLHRPENKVLSENREKIYVFVSNEQYTDDGASIKTRTARAFTPFWHISGGIRTPTGLAGMSDEPLGTTVGSGVVEIDQVTKYGRGIGRARPSNYSQYELSDDDNDLRFKFPNWVRMEDLVYNHPELKVANDPYYGKNIQSHDENGNPLVNDSVRVWFDWPHYKIHYADPTAVKPDGGYGNMYCYRLAETYLLRAEAYFWKGNLQQAVNDINMIRTRAGCDPWSASDVNIGTILDERARELFNEEPRKTELTRIAFIFAESGGAAYNGKSYSMNNFSEDNFWYDRVYEKNNYYRENVQTRFYIYRIAPHLVLWPIPAPAINANTLGVINQNKGYPSFGVTVTPWIWKDGEGEGEIVPQ